MQPTKAEKALAMQDGPERDALLKECIIDRAGAPYGPFKFDSKKQALAFHTGREDISLPLATQVISRIIRHDHVLDTSGMLEYTKDFTRDQAVDLVVKAFQNFDHGMADKVEKAYKEKRISFEPSYMAHAAPVGNDHAPDDIKKQSARLAGKWYVSVPCEGEKLTVNDLYRLAHESMHLALTETCQNASGKPDTLGSALLHETFSLFSEHLMHEQLMQSLRKGGSQHAQAEQAYEIMQHKNMFGMAKLAAAELELLHLAHAGDKAALDKLAGEKVQEQLGRGLLTYEPFYSMTYPVAAMASRALFDDWKSGQLGVAERMEQVAAGNMNFEDAMRHMGVDTASANFVGNGIRAYEKQERTLAQELQRLRPKGRADQVKAGMALGDACQHPASRAHTFDDALEIRLGSVVEVTPRSREKGRE